MLTAWSAVALCDAVERACGVRPGIKWPNDLVLRGKKLCGVLTELELEAETGHPRYVIVGIGTNVFQMEADFGPEVAPIAISLAQVLDTRRSGPHLLPRSSAPWTPCTRIFPRPVSSIWSSTAKTA